MKKSKKLITSIILIATILLSNISYTAQAYTEKNGNLTYSCKKSGTLSSAQVKKGAKQLEKGTKILNWGAFIANLSPGGFIYDLTVIQAGDIKDSWIKAAAAGKSAQIDHCEATNPGNTNGNGVLAYENVKFK